MFFKSIIGATCALFLSLFITSTANAETVWIGSSNTYSYDSVIYEVSASDASYIGLINEPYVLPGSIGAMTAVGNEIWVALNLGYTSIIVKVDSSGTVINDL